MPSQCCLADQSQTKVVWVETHETPRFMSLDPYDLGLRLISETTLGGHRSISSSLVINSKHRRVSSLSTMFGFPKDQEFNPSHSSFPFVLQIRETDCFS